MVGAQGDSFHKNRALLINLFSYRVGVWHDSGFCRVASCLFSPQVLLCFYYTFTIYFRKTIVKSL